MIQGLIIGRVSIRSHQYLHYMIQETSRACIRSLLYDTGIKRLLQHNTANGSRWCWRPFRTKVSPLPTYTSASWLRKKQGNTTTQRKQKGHRKKEVLHILRSSRGYTTQFQDPERWTKDMGMRHDLLKSAVERRRVRKIKRGGFTIF